MRSSANRRQIFFLVSISYQPTPFTSNRSIRSALKRLDVPLHPPRMHDVVPHEIGLLAPGCVAVARPLRLRHRVPHTLTLPAFPPRALGGKHSSSGPVCLLFPLTVRALRGRDLRS